MFPFFRRDPRLEGLQSDREPAGPSTGDVRSARQSATTGKPGEIWQIIAVTTLAEDSASVEGGIDILSQNDRQYSDGESLVRHV